MANSDRRSATRGASGGNAEARSWIVSGAQQEAVRQPLKSAAREHEEDVRWSTSCLPNFLDCGEVVAIYGLAHFVDPTSRTSPTSSTSIFKCTDQIFLRGSTGILLGQLCLSERTSHLPE